MKHGHYRLAVQEGSRAYFGVVELDVRDAPTNGLSVEFDPRVVEWRAGLTSGVTYAASGTSTFPK